MIEATYDTIILSDLHLGSEMSRAQDPLDVLQTYSYRRLVLLGDIFSDLKNFPAGPSVCDRYVHDVRPRGVSKAGGFNEHAPCAEDYSLTKQIARKRFAVISGAVMTSNRRFRKMGRQCQHRHPPVATVSTAT